MFERVHHRPFFRNLIENYCASSPWIEIPSMDIFTELKSCWTINRNGFIPKASFFFTYQLSMLYRPTIL